MGHELNFTYMILMLWGIRMYKNSLSTGTTLSRLKIGDVVGDQLNFVYIDTENNSTVWPGLFTCFCSVT